MQLIKLVKAERLLESLAQEKMGVGLSYKFMKLLKAMADDDEFYRQEANKIIEKYAVRDENDNIVRESNGVVMLDMSRQEELDEETRQLNETVVEMPNIKFRVEELQGLQLSVADLMILDDFIEEV